MSPSEMTRASKFLSLVLRHRPSAAGIPLDENGWTSVDALLEGCAGAGVRLSREDLAQVVGSNDKERFAFSEDGARIRANQGHSVEVDLDLAPSTPPNTLFHGTIDRFLGAIRKQGLLKMSRHHVHLSADEETASRVGGRRGEAVVLMVDAARMSAGGHAFFVSSNGVWLTDHVPAQYLRFPGEAP